MKKQTVSFQFDTMPAPFRPLRLTDAAAGVLLLAGIWGLLWQCLRPESVPGLLGLGALAALGLAAGLLLRWDRKWQRAALCGALLVLLAAGILLRSHISAALAGLWTLTVAALLWALTVAALLWALSIAALLRALPVDGTVLARCCRVIVVTRTVALLRTLAVAVSCVGVAAAVTWAVACCARTLLAAAKCGAESFRTESALIVACCANV